MEHNQLNIKTPEYVSLKFQTAGLGSRAAAQIMDQLILLTTQMILILFLFFFMDNPLMTYFFSEGNSVAIAIFIILVFVINFGYFIFLEYIWAGRTIGKRMLGIRVIQENGHRITVLSSIIRNFVRLIDMLPSAYAVGILFVFFHSKHKRLGDIAAGTIVVHEHRRKNKASPLGNYIESKGLQEEMLEINAFQLKRLTQKDWELLQTYCQRAIHLKSSDRNPLTNQVAQILLPKVDIPLSSHEEVREDQLLLLYLHARKDWDIHL
ncbi:RDD family protein [Gracilibacillus sp. YIM 98692]|uniref:RDD family protein n=1 Tax=Gracilibacillus sp. YIM 98692 TaxID=2663532 RepID=UPI0013CF9EF5|nr:RDD family protein [Gracilibacillus sp. YIM 98692]